MKQKRLKEKTVRLTGQLIIWSVSIVVKIIPEALLYGLSRILGNAAFLVEQRRRKRTIENLTSVFKNEKSPQEIKKMAKRVFCEIAEHVFDTIIFLLKKPDIEKDLMKSISVEGAEHLDEALKDKKGVICVNAHFGNLMMMTPRLSLMGYPCNMIANLSDNPLVAYVWGTMMRDANIQWIPAQPKMKSVSGSMRWLRSGGVLLLYADGHQNDGVYVEFFGRPAGTVEGPAVLHLRTGAPMLCAFIIRQGRKKHKIVITPPIPVETTDNREEDVYQATQAFTKIIEDFVRRYPEHLWWFRKRWKRNR